MSKVFVDREDIEAVRNTLANGGQAVSVLRWAENILAQPAEAEGVEMGSDAWMALHLLDRLDVSADEEPRVQQVEEIVRRMGAALSAVTAERDRLRKDRDDCVEARVHYAGKLGEVMAERDQLRAEVEVEVEGMRAQRDKMAQILRDLVPGCKWRFMRPRIDQALQEVDGGN